MIRLLATAQERILAVMGNTSPRLIRRSVETLCATKKINKEIRSGARLAVE